VARDQQGGHGEGEESKLKGLGELVAIAPRGKWWDQPKYPQAQANYGEIGLRASAAFRRSLVKLLIHSE
jgi:hypothetical protein